MRYSLVLPIIASILTVACRSVNPQARALIAFERSGGIAGQTVRLIVQENGDAKLYARSDTASQAIPPDTLARLKDLLQSIGFDTLQAEYRPSLPGADRFEYIIEHHGHHVHCYDGTIPPKLQPLIDLLNGLVRPRP